MYRRQSQRVRQTGSIRVAGHLSGLQLGAAAHARQVCAKCDHAAHVSHWSTKIDIGTNPWATLDVASIGRKTAAFHNTAGITGNPHGISRYDLLFFDPSDRDAAYYQYVQNDGGAHWWDETNQGFPNFEHYREYIKYMIDGTGRRAMLWQVPINGNNAVSQHADDDGGYLRIFGGRYYQIGAYRFDTATLAPTPTPTVYVPQSLSLDASANVYVSANSKTKNYGKAAALRSDGSPVEQSFIRFNTGSFSGDVASAKLRLYVTNGSAAAGRTWRQIGNPSWSETGVTYNNRPRIDGLQLASLNKVDAGKWIEFDVTVVLSEPGLYSFAISQAGGDNLIFASCEATTSANRPQLVITLR